jgi:hypothetical protein
MLRLKIEQSIKRALFLYQTKIQNSSPSMIHIYNYYIDCWDIEVIKVC